MEDDFTTTILQIWIHAGRWMPLGKLGKDSRASKCQSSTSATDHKTTKSQKCWFFQASGGHLTWLPSQSSSVPPAAAALVQWDSRSWAERGQGTQVLTRPAVPLQNALCSTEKRCIKQNVGVPSYNFWIQYWQKDVLVSTQECIDQTIIILWWKPFFFFLNVLCCYYWWESAIF